MDYTEAINRLADELGSLWARAEGWGLTNKEIAEEYRRIAKECEHVHDARRQHR